MSELKAYRFLGQDEVWPDANLGSDYYLKSEADKLLAELEESHKMEVEQLLMEIAELEDKALQFKVLNEEHCRDLNTQERFFAEQIAHQKYKRCMAMAKLCNEKWLVHNFAEITSKLRFYDKWQKRWLELAEKFKEAQS